MSQGDFERKYIESGSLVDREISKAEAEQAGSYRVHCYQNGKLHHVELVQQGAVITVMYKEAVWPDEDIEVWHKANYGGVPYDIQTPKTVEHDKMVCRVYGMNGSGEYRECIKNTFDDRGNLVIEERMTPSGDTFERTEYEYDKDNELRVTRIYGKNGELYDEITDE